MSLGSSQPLRVAGTVTVSASTTSANVATVGPGLLQFKTGSVLVFNSSASVAFISLGVGNTLVATVANDIPIPPGGSRLLHSSGTITYAAAILLSGTGNVYFTFGDGDTY